MTEWIVSSSVLILAVALARQALKGRLSLRLQYALWALVLARLLVPVSFGQSRISVMNAVDEKQSAQITVDIPPSRADYTPPNLTPVEPDPALPAEEREEQYRQNQQQWQSQMDADWEQYKAENTNEVTVSVSEVLRIVWYAGMAVMALCLLGSNLSFWLRLRRSRRPLEGAGCPLPVYVTGAAETPCLFGLLRPAVYVTPEAADDGAALGHVLAHEYTHCRHGDHLWSLARCLCLTLHWYNPLVWLAASLSRRDAELACDEGTLRRIGEGERLAYGRTLIGLTCARRGGLLRTATTMTGSKGSIKERITLIAKKPRMAAYTLIAVLLIAAVAAGCTFTGAKRDAAAEWAAMLTEESVSGVTVYGGSGQALGRLDRDGRGELLAVIGGITEKMCRAPEEGGTAEEGQPSLTVYQGLNLWSFRCREDGLVRLEPSRISSKNWVDPGYEVGVEEMVIDCPELYQFILDRAAAYSGDMTQTSEALAMELDDAPQTVRRTIEDYVAQQAAATDRAGSKAEITALAVMNTGTAAQEWSIELYRLEYRLTFAGGGEDDAPVDRTDYLAFLWEYTVSEKQTCAFIGAMSGDELAETYGTPEKLEAYGGDMFIAAAMGIYHDFLLTGTPACPATALRMIHAGGETLLTLYTAGEGQQRTLSVGLDKLSEVFSGRTVTAVDAPSAVPGGDWLTVTNAGGGKTLTVWSGEEGLVGYTDGSGSRYWAMDSGGDCAVLLRSLYDSLAASPYQVVFYSQGPEMAAEQFPLRYCRMLTELPADHPNRVTDYEVLDWGITETSSADRPAVLGWMEYAVRPAFDPESFIAGSAEPGAGEYEGWVLNRVQFVLTPNEVGLWHCIDWGGGIISLADYGYENGMIGAVMGDPEVYLEGQEPVTAAYFQELLGFDGGETCYNGALTCVYAAPEDIALEYVFYNGFPGGEEWQDFTAREQAYLMGRNQDKNLGFGHLPAQKRPAEQLEAMLQRYFGVSLSDVKIPDSWVYYDATDSYYSCHSDTHAMEGLTVTRAVDQGNGVYHIWYTSARSYAQNPATGQTYTDMVLTVRRNAAGGYTVLSNLPASGRGIVLEDAEAWPQEAVWEFARVYGAELMSIPGYITDYEIIWCEPREISVNGDAVIGFFRCIARSSGSGELMALNGWEETNDGRWVFDTLFLLERAGGTGRWYCSQWKDIGQLADYGYEDGMIGAIMGNTEVYRCEGDDPYEAALTLMTAYVEDLLVPAEMRSFTITEYRNLSVTLKPTLELDEAEIFNYQPVDGEMGENTWIVELRMEYRWDGVLMGPPYGPGIGHEDYWADLVHQGSPVGFLLTRNGNEFTLQSRYAVRH